MISVAGVHDDERWPAYAAAARARAPRVRSQLSLGLRFQVEERASGVLDLYSTRLERIDQDVELVARLFAEHANIALRAARRTSDLTAALDTRADIGKAVGPLMARHGLTDEGAFAYLARVSSRSNTKVRDIAARLLAEACAGAERDANAELAYLELPPDSPTSTARAPRPVRL